eukprot:1860017-Pyramimonas_sp.AAC.1
MTDVVCCCPASGGSRLAPGPASNDAEGWQPSPREGVQTSGEPRCEKARRRMSGYTSPGQAHPEPGIGACIRIGGCMR